MENFERITNELIDGFIDKGQCDFMADFADPYAARILTHLIGLPQEVSQDILTLSSEMGLALGVTFKENLDKIENATAKIYAFVDEVIERRLIEPGDDILSMLASASVGGDSLSRDELRNMAVMLAFAGVDTTRNQLGLGLSMFMDNPEQWEHLAADPSLDMAASN